MNLSIKKISVAAMAAALACVSTSCGNGEKKTAETPEQTTVMQDTIMPISQADALKAIDSMVEVVTSDSLPASALLAKYNAEFFNNPENASYEPAPGKYSKNADGLKYVIINKGDTVRPTPTDVVKVNYIGELTNGTVFDSSIERGEPISFPLNGVIQGWTQGLQLMGQGGQAVLYIPSSLAYGSQDNGTIPPNSTLIFWVQLLQVNPTEQ